MIRKHILAAPLAAAAAIAVTTLTTGPALAAPTGGANQPCATYCPTNVGEPSGNGNATNQPAAGTVGNADSKYPPGQAPSGLDANKGYECDENQGIGKTNPAHSGCDIDSQ